MSCVFEFVCVIQQEANRSTTGRTGNLDGHDSATGSGKSSQQLGLLGREFLLRQDALLLQTMQFSSRATTSSADWAGAATVGEDELRKGTRHRLPHRQSGPERLAGSGDPAFVARRDRDAVGHLILRELAQIANHVHAYPLIKNLLQFFGQRHVFDNKTVESQAETRKLRVQKS